MVEFVTIKAEEIKFGDGKFLEVAKKKAITEEGENEFVSLSRGFFTPEGERRYRKSFTVPLEKEIIDFIVAKIPEVFASKDTGAAPEAAEAKPQKKEEKPKEEVKEEEPKKEVKEEEPKEEKEKE